MNESIATTSASDTQISAKPAELVSVFRETSPVFLTASFMIETGARP